MSCGCGDSCGSINNNRGPAGKPGANILFGNGAPSNTLGINRDTYIDEDNG